MSGEYISELFIVRRFVAGALKRNFLHLRRVPEGLRNFGNPNALANWGGRQIGPIGSHTLPS